MGIYTHCSCVTQMYRHWRNWVWVYWVVWKRWWRNSSAGGKLQRRTSSCSEILPSRSGFAPRIWSIITIRKLWKGLTWTFISMWYVFVNRLLVWVSYILIVCSIVKFVVGGHSQVLYVLTSSVSKSQLSIHGLLSLLTLNCEGCSVSEGHCSKKYSLETVWFWDPAAMQMLVHVCWVLSWNKINRSSNWLTCESNDPLIVCGKFSKVL